MPLSTTAAAPGRFADLTTRLKTGATLIAGFLALAFIEQTVTSVPLIIAAIVVAYICLDEDWMRGLQPKANSYLPGGEQRWRNYGIAYLAPPLLAFCLLAACLPGALYWCITITVAADIGAYLFGRMFGGPLLWERVSPKKTRMGALSGTFVAIIASVFWQDMAPANLTLPLSGATLFPLTVLVTWAGMGGDLFESWLKRRADVKDSSDRLPGMGGFLDRLDSHLAAILVTGLFFGGRALYFALFT